METIFIDSCVCIQPRTEQKPKYHNERNVDGNAKTLKKKQNTLKGPFHGIYWSQTGYVTTSLQAKIAH